MWRGKITCRRVAVLAAHLPPEAMIHRDGPDARAWSTEAQMLAHLIDLAAVNVWIAAGGKPASKPKPIPRPSDSVGDAARDAAVLAKMRRFQQRQQN